MNGGLNCGSSSEISDEANGGIKNEEAEKEVNTDQADNPLFGFIKFPQVCFARSINDVTNDVSNTHSNVHHAKYEKTSSSSGSSSRLSSWFDLRSLMLCYNTLMVAINCFFFFWFAAHIDFGRKFIDFSYPSFDDVSEQTLYEIQMISIYFWTKPLDLLDTVFFSLRGKSSHLTFLHLYHHTLVPLLGWLALRVNPMVTFIYLFGLINSLVHTVMYSYYALASFGAKFQKYLWWKRYITLLQIGQFIVYGIHVSALFIFQKNYPRLWLYLCGIQPLIFTHLFYQFYRKTYHSNSGLKASSKDISSNQDLKLKVK
jgi:hypothetical protein